MPGNSREIKITFRVGDDGTLKVLDSVGTKLRTVSSAAEQVGTRGAAGFSKFTVDIVTMNQAVQLASRLFQTTAQSVTRVTNVMDTFLSFEGRIRAVSSANINAAQTMQELLLLAQRARAPFQTVGDVYARFALATREYALSQRQLVTLTETVAKSAIVSGATMTEASAGLIQFSQALASGRFSGDELRSVLEQLPRLARAIAEGMGVSVGKLRELGAAGKLVPAVLLQAIQQQAGQIEAEFQRMPRTFGQAVEIARTNVIALIGQMDRTTGVTEVLGRSVVAVSEQLRGLDVKAVLPFFENLYRTVKPLTPVLSELAVVVGTLGQALSALPVDLLQLLLIGAAARGPIGRSLSGIQVGGAAGAIGATTLATSRQPVQMTMPFVDAAANRMLPSGSQLELFGQAAATTAAASVVGALTATTLNWTAFLKARMGPAMQQAMSEGVTHAEAHTIAIRKLSAEYQALKAGATVATESVTAAAGATTAVATEAAATGVAVVTLGSVFAQVKSAVWFAAKRAGIVVVAAEGMLLALRSLQQEFERESERLKGRALAAGAIGGASAGVGLLPPPGTASRAVYLYDREAAIREYTGNYAGRPPSPIEEAAQMTFRTAPTMTEDRVGLTQGERARRLAEATTDLTTLQERQEITSKTQQISDETAIRNAEHRVELLQMAGASAAALVTATAAADAAEHAKLQNQRTQLSDVARLQQELVELGAAGAMEALQLTTAQIAELDAALGRVDGAYRAILLSAREHATMEMTATEAAVVRARGELEAAQHQVAVAERRGKSESEILRLQGEVDRAQTYMWETQEQVVNAQIVYAHELGTTPRDIALAATEQQRLTAMTERGADAAAAYRDQLERSRKVTLNLGDLLQQGAGRALEGLFSSGKGVNLGTVMKNTATSMATEFGVGLLKAEMAKGLFDQKVSENFNVTLPGFMKSGTASISSTWNNLMGDMADTTTSGTGGIISTFGRMVSYVGGMLRNVPGVGNIVGMFGGGSAATGGTRVPPGYAAAMGTSNAFESAMTSGSGSGSGFSLAGLGSLGAGGLALGGLSQVASREYIRGGALIGAAGALASLSGTTIAGISASALGAAGGVLGGIAIIGGGIYNATRGGRTTINAGAGTAIGAAGGALAGTAIYPGIGTIIGAVVGAIMGSLGSAGPTREHIYLDSIREWTDKAGIAKASGTIGGRPAWGDHSTISRVYPGVTDTGPLQAYGSALQAIMVGGLGHNKDLMGDAVNAFVNNQQLLGNSLAESKEDLRALAQTAGVDFKIAMTELREQFEWGNIDLANYTKGVAGLTDIFKEDFPEALDAAAIALKNMVSGHLNLPAYEKELSRQASAYSNWQSAAWDQAQAAQDTIFQTKLGLARPGQQRQMMMDRLHVAQYVGGTAPEDSQMKLDAWQEIFDVGRWFAGQAGRRNQQYGLRLMEEAAGGIKSQIDPYTEALHDNTKALLDLKSSVDETNSAPKTPAGPTNYNNTNNFNGDFSTLTPDEVQALVTSGIQDWIARGGLGQLPL